MKRLAILTIVLFIVCHMTNITPVQSAPSQQEGFNAEKALSASVFVRQVYTNAVGQVITSCVGSGTIVSNDGLILTNAHNALNTDGCRTEKLVIELTIRPGESPFPSYYAEPVATNVGWDLAVLRVTTTIDGRAVDHASLNLPFAAIGDSEQVGLDSTIYIVGFVSKESSETSDIIHTTIGGFMAETRVGERAWMKTSVAIPGGMSGGAAYDLNGRLIAIPTVEPARNSGEALNCRRIQDSNADGRVDTNDTCVPVSGFINAMRPSRLARGLVLAAELGISPLIKPGTQPLPPVTGEPRFSRLFFSPGVDIAGMPTAVVDSMPQGTERLFIFFDYENMRDGMIYELRTTRDGVPDQRFSLAPATWSGGTRGLWYIGSTAQVWPNGTYDFSLFIEGVRSANKQITIGTAARTEPIFNDIVFGVLNPDGGLASVGNVLPVGNTVNAAFVYNNMPPSVGWTQVWYYENLKISEVADTWKEVANGKLQINATAAELKPGRYRLELYIGERLAATSDFIMAGALDALKTSIFNTLSFTSDIEAATPASTPTTTFTTPIQNLYATFNWRGLAPGIPFTWRWSVDENPLFEVTQDWQDAADGAQGWLRLLTSQTKITDGSYKLDLFVGGVNVGSATAKVGLGQLPVTIFGVSEGVQVFGRITDAETGKGIPGVAFIVIKVDYDTRNFVWDMEQVYDLSYSDAEGNYRLTKLLLPEVEKTYSIMVIAQGYLPIPADGIAIRDDTESPLVYNIALSKD